MYFRCRKCFWWKFKQTYLIAVGIAVDISVVQFKYSSADLSDKEKSIVFYLAEYVFSTFSRRLRFTKKNNRNTETVQEYLAILAAGKLGDEKQELPEHKLVNTKNRGGLWKVTAEDFEIFCIAEQIFKKRTETWQY